jgi:nitroimidazol reductase NimA-like FMN-containing flavoprotein (pyridoxamine 5'-phosphate oxidase superfamily)
MNNQIRQKLRECHDQQKINTFLQDARIGFLGLSDQNHPYVIPVNYVWDDNYVYFHGSAEGRKNNVMESNPNVSFTVCEELGTIANPVPARVDTAYFSVFIVGKVEVVESIEEATEVLQLLLHKYVPDYYQAPLAQKHVETYRSSLGSPVGVFKIKITDLTAKENPRKEDMMFHPGRTVHQDI